MIKICKLGDIIVVNDYIAENGKHIGKHSFVVINDENGKIAGLSYHFVTSVISSFKSEQQKAKKLKHIENMELPLDSLNGTDWKKSSYIKADKLFYFNKDKLDYYIFATLKKKYMDELLKLILKLEKAGKLEQVIVNL